MNKIVIQYQTHKKLTNINNLKEINGQLRKLETPHNQITHHQTTLSKTLTQEQKVNLESLKGIMNGEKTTLSSLRNIVWRAVNTETNKINQVIPYKSTNNITELNEQIYAGTKLVCEKIGIPFKGTKKKSKPG